MTSGRVPKDSYLCGWRVRSELALPELTDWDGDDREPDLRIRFGDAPSSLDDGVELSPLAQVDPRGLLLLTLPDVATFYVAGADEVVIAPAKGAAEVEIRLFLLGSVLGFLCHLRGLFPLHASCVAIDGKAVAFCGPSGAGKSTTALHMARRGHPLVADDVTAIDWRSNPAVLPAFPRLKLWQDSLESLGVDPQGLERNRPGQSKFHYRLPAGFQASPPPLEAVVLLRRGEPGQAAELVRVTSAVEAIVVLDAEVFRPRTAELLGRKPLLLQAEARIAQSVPVYRLTRPFAFDQMDEWLPEIEALVRG